jgi:hypothetical protein
MRLLNADADKSLKRVTVYLTQSEAEELRDSLLALLDEPCGNHSHVPSEDFQKELTVCIYREDDLTSFNARSQRLIQTDE